MDFIKVLLECAKKTNIGIETRQAEQFLLYKDILVECNSKLNLTAITDPEEIIIKHFIDSLTCAEFIQGNNKMIDVGTGAGFPGIPLKILLGDQVEITLLDSLNKRISFLNQLIDHLKLEGIKAVHGRAEDMAVRPGYRENFDAALSRAVSNMSVLAEYCLPFVSVGGRMVSMKGPRVEEELSEAGRAIKILGGRVERVEKVRLPCLNITHSIVVINKVESTPKGYPRKAGKAEKQPIR